MVGTAGFELATPCTPCNILKIHSRAIRFKFINKINILNENNHLIEKFDVQ